MIINTGDTRGDKLGTLGTPTVPALGTLGTTPLEGVSLSPGGICPQRASYFSYHPRACAWYSP